ncbi:hypothetical protein SSPIM334S_00415 [Streptomyces spiroverticillatus]
MNSGGQKPIASEVYSSLSPILRRASARIRPWSKASGDLNEPSSATHCASAASPPPLGSGRSGTSAAKATDTTRIRGSRSGSL